MSAVTTTITAVDTAQATPTFTTSDVAQLLVAAATFLLVIAVLFQVRSDRKSATKQIEALQRSAQVARRDFQHRFNVETMEFYRATLNETWAARQRITNRYGIDVIPPDEADSLNAAASQSDVNTEDAEIGAAIRLYLNAYERLAVAVNSGMADKGLMERLAKNRIQLIADQFRYYIDAVRRTHSSLHIYEELVSLAREWETSQSHDDSMHTS